MQKGTDTLDISVVQREELQAVFADLHVSVKGSSLISGGEALRKAKEVSQLVDEMVRAGLAPEAVSLQSVHAENSSGAVLRTSSATYSLRFRCQNLDLFADLISVIFSQKNCSLDRVEWNYPEDEAHETGLEKAIKKADDRARKIAAALGVHLLGVASFNEKMVDLSSNSPQPKMMPQAPSRAMGIISQPDLGIDVQNSKMVEIRVEISYHISRFGASASAEAESESGWDAQD